MKFLNATLITVRVNIYRARMFGLILIATVCGYALSYIPIIGPYFGRLAAWAGRKAHGYHNFRWGDTRCFYCQKELKIEEFNQWIDTKPACDNCVDEAFLSLFKFPEPKQPEATLGEETHDTV